MKTYTVEQMLAAVQRKRFSGRGIGTADGYVQTVFNQATQEGFVKQFPGKSADDFRAMVKASATKLVFRPSGAEMLAYTKQKKFGAGVVSFGKSVRKEGQTLSTASVMDFENILTSKNRDRDGDELHPKGAKVDPSMPLLWQHIPTEPIGKLVQVLEQTDDVIKTHFAIADTALGRDSAMLVEFGALRISHGFKPVKYEALEEDADGEPTGWKVLEYDVMEGSLVSVPANTDAVITAFSRNKLNSPLVKGWAGGMYADRPKMVKGGYGGIVKNAGGNGGSVNVTINMPKGTKGAKPAKKNAGVDFGVITHAKGTAGVKCFKCGAVGMIQVNAEDIDEARSMMLDIKCPTCGSQGNLRVRNYRKGVEAPKKKEQKPEPNTSGKEKPEGLNDETPTLLSDVATRAGEMAENEGLSNEIRSRMSVVSGIITDVAGDIASGMEQITAAAGSQDLAGVSSAHNDMIGAAAKRLQRAADELAKVAEAGDLEESDAEAIKEMTEQVNASLTGISGAMDEEEGDTVDPDSEEESGGDGDETGQWVDTGAAPSGNDEEEEDEDDSELEEEEEEEEEKENDDEETEEKEEDEDETEEKEEEETEDKDDDEDTEEKAGQVLGMHCLDCNKTYVVDTDERGSMKCPKCGSKNWEIVNRTNKEDDGEDTEEKEEDDEETEEKSDDEDRDEIEKSDDEEKEEDGKTEPKGSKEDDEEETEEKETDDENPEAEADPEEENPGVGKGKKKPKKDTASLRAKRLAADIVGGKTIDKETRKMLRSILGDD